MDSLPHELATIIVVLACKIESCAGLLRCVCPEWRDIIDQNNIIPKTSPRWINTIAQIEYAVQSGYRGNVCKCIGCRRVAKYNHLKILEWMRLNGMSYGRIYNSARFGHYNMIEWIKANGIQKGFGHYSMRIKSDS
jgi:hypothetical protein